MQLFFCHGIGIKTVFGYTIVVSGEQLRAMQCTLSCSRLLLLQVEPRTEKGNMDFFVSVQERFNVDYCINRNVTT